MIFMSVIFVPDSMGVAVYDYMYLECCNQYQWGIRHLSFVFGKSSPTSRESIEVKDRNFVRDAQLLKWIYVI